MKLGVNSISLSVKDLKKSQAFYTAMGFEIFAGSHEMNYLIMKNEKTIIGLFQGMFEGNIITFNPGWDENANTLGFFDDVRHIQKSLKQSGIALITEVDEASTGPANFMLEDPDGNKILIDQHV